MITKNPDTLENIFSFPLLNLQNRKHTAFTQNYKLKKPFTFVNNTTLLGIELEVEQCPNCLDFEYFWTETVDHSLRNNGKEYISIPLRAKQIPYAIEYLTDGLNYYNPMYKFSNRCSTHIHLNVKDFTEERLKVFILLYSIFEKHFFNIAGSKRESNIFCVPLYKTEELEKTINLLTDISIWNKYNALNLGCILGSNDNQKIGTIEFRHLYGTLDTDILYPWINSIIELRLASLRYSYLDLIDKIQTLNTTSEYVALYKEVFKITALPLTFITKLDFESCITTTKLSLFKKLDITNTLIRKDYEKSFFASIFQPTLETNSETISQIYMNLLNISPNQTVIFDDVMDHQPGLQ